MQNLRKYNPVLDNDRKLYRHEKIKSMAQNNQANQDGFGKQPAVANGLSHLQNVTNIGS